MAHHLAQANIARMRAPLEDPLMAGFAALLDPINTLADQAPGFLWRLQGEEEDAAVIRVFDDPLILFNMSVWDSIEALFAYVYKSDHVLPLSNRKEWFAPMDGPGQVLWWISQGQIPSVEVAKGRLETLATQGPTLEAFTFAKRFPAPD